MTESEKPDPVVGMKVRWVNVHICKIEMADWVYKRCMRVYGLGPFAIGEVIGGEKNGKTRTALTVTLTENGSPVYERWVGKTDKPADFIDRVAQFNWRHLEPIEP